YSLHGIINSCVEPEDAVIVSKMVNTPDYADYFKKWTQLRKEKEAVEAKFREARRTRNREALKQIQKEMRQNVGEEARLEMTHPGAPVRAMAIVDSPKPK